MNIKLASWNINSVKIHKQLLKDFCIKQSPDILCLQETKIIDDLFPKKFFSDELGFKYINLNGQKAYNGVAILSKIPVSGVKIARFLNDDARHIAIKILDDMEIHNFYVPAGGDIPDCAKNSKFQHKISYLDEMYCYLKKRNNRKRIILGDFNIAPLALDVWSSKQLENVVSHTDIEVCKLISLKTRLNFLDAFRYRDTESKIYSWWSYRNRDWRKSNRGRRLDHIWISRDITSYLQKSNIFLEYRDYKPCSDHVPIMVELQG